MICRLIKFCVCATVILLLLNRYSFAQKKEPSAPGSAVTSEEDSINTISNDYEDTGDTLIVKAFFDTAGNPAIKWKRTREFGYMAYIDSFLRKRTDLRIDTVRLDKSTVNKSRIAAYSPRDSTNSFLNSLGVRIFFWTIAVCFVGFILYKLFFTAGLFTKGNTRGRGEPVQKEPELLNEYLEYNTLIQEAESKNNWNLSVRYLYLQSLKRLADRGLISFSADKTNNLYIQDLSGRTYQKDFAFLTLNYEYIWYGNFIIDKRQYSELKSAFISFNKKL